MRNSPSEIKDQIHFPRPAKSKFRIIVKANPPQEGLPAFGIRLSHQTAGSATPSIFPLDFTRGLEEFERLGTVRLSNGAPTERPIKFRRQKTTDGLEKEWGHLCISLSEIPYSTCATLEGLPASGGLRGCPATWV